MSLSKRIQGLSPSSTLQITSLAKKLSQNKALDIISFGAGEPDFDTPEFIKEAAIQAIKAGFTKYTPSTGIPELKKAIQQKFKKENSLICDSGQVVVSSGAKHCLFNIIMALVDPDDEVIIPAPYWVSYPEMVICAGGKPVIINTSNNHGLKITAKQLDESIGPRTKLFIINSPSNPTGVVYTQKELQELSGICAKKNIYVISDEIYEKLIYDGLRHYSIAASGQLDKLAFTVNGVSKAYSMTGWRIGYFAGPIEIVNGIKNLQDHSTSNPCSIAQKAALCALTGDGAWTRQMAQEFEKRRDYLMRRIEKIPQISFVRPQGAFYLFCNISKTGLKASEFCTRLLQEAGVAVIPGEGFGCPDYIRLSFAVNIETIKKGIDKLELWLRQLPKKS